MQMVFSTLENKYRDIADGNIVDIATDLVELFELETKYRDIADGNPQQPGLAPGWE